MKNIKKIFKLPAVDTSIEHGCVTPLYNIFSWQEFANGQTLQKRLTDIKATWMTIKIYQA